MLYLYLDESGDLGFDFVNKKPSKFFTITILAIRGSQNNRLLIKAVKKTLVRKLNRKKSIVAELKSGLCRPIPIKKHERALQISCVEARANTWKGAPRTICNGLTAHLYFEQFA